MMEKKNPFLEWLEKVWDDGLVYVASVIGSLCALWYTAEQAGQKFALKLGYVIIAAFLAIIGTGIVEWMRHRAAEQKGTLVAHLTGKKNRILPRMGVSWAVGYVVQLAFPIVADALAKALSAMAGSAG